MSHAIAFRPLATARLAAGLVFGGSILAAASPAIAGGGGGGGGAVYDHRVVALSGQSAPGLAAGQWTAFDLPSINASGQIAFHGETDGSFVDYGLWTTKPDDPQDLRIIIGTDLFPPDAPPGVRYARTELFYVHPMLNDDGSIGFWTHLDGYPDDPADLRGSIFRFDGTTIEAVAHPGDTVPGIPGATLAWIGNLAGRSAGGLLTFDARLEGPGITEDNDYVQLVEWFGGLTAVIREGGPAPGMPGVTWSPIVPFPETHVASNGRLTFLSETSDDFLFGAHAIWQGFPGAIEAVVKTGDPLPNGQPFRRFSFPDRFATNDAGSVVAQLSFGLPDPLGEGLFRFGPGGDEVILLDGQPAPFGTWQQVESGFQMGPDGTVVFIARLAGVPADADTGLFRQRPGQPVELLVREGDQPFGSNPGVEFDDLTVADVTVIDGSGRIHFRANRRGPGMTPEWHDGVWTIEPDGTVNVVLRGQQAMTVAPFDVRFVHDIRFWSGDGPETGLPAGVNERGDLALRVGFHDGSEAIVHAWLPPDCPADRDGDGVITFDDLLIVLGDFGRTGPIGTGGDADWDGDTDFDDLLVILGAFGTACDPF